MRDQQIIPDFIENGDCHFKGTCEYGDVELTSSKLKKQQGTEQIKVRNSLD